MSDSTTSVTATSGVSAAYHATQPTLAEPTDLLPPPVVVPCSDVLVAMLLASASKSREAHRALQSAKSAERVAAQADEIATLHDEADNALIGGIVSGSTQITSGALKLEGSLDAGKAADLKATAADGQTAPSLDSLHTAAPLEQSAARYNFGGTLADAGVGFSQAVTQANGKELEADAKSASSRADGAKEGHDEAGDGVREEHDLEQAILRAYEALIGSRSQQVQTLLATRG